MLWYLDLAGNTGYLGILNSQQEGAMTTPVFISRKSESGLVDFDWEGDRIPRRNKF